MKNPLDNHPDVAKYFRDWGAVGGKKGGKKGGSARTPAKIESSRRNIAKATKARLAKMAKGKT